MDPLAMNPYCHLLVLVEAAGSLNQYGARFVAGLFLVVPSSLGVVPAIGALISAVHWLGFAQMGSKAQACSAMIESRLG